MAGEIAAPLEQKSFGYYYDVVQLRILGLKGLDYSICLFSHVLLYQQYE